MHLILSVRHKDHFQQLIYKLKRLSLKRGYSKNQIAAELGVSRTCIYQWWIGYSLSAKRRTISRKRTSQTYKFLRSAKRATRSDGDRDQCFAKKMESSSLTPDSCVCYPAESHISRGIDCTGGLAALSASTTLSGLAWIVRSLMPIASQPQSARTRVCRTKAVIVTTFLEPVVRPDPAGLWACSKHVPPPCAAPLIPCSHRDNSVPRVSLRQRAS